MNVNHLHRNERLGFEAFRGYYNIPMKDALRTWTSVELNTRAWWMRSGQAVKDFLEKDVSSPVKGTLDRNEKEVNDAS